ncbi:polysaccharide deacetylase family protein [Bacillus thuringiensis]|uniref:polysaccharide deacetylase family protein n=1 Tax=Bacillus thuringiensis TaxID=1428 RepID=UPI0021D67559|nr:polysaccharide deacetylase family protein [Bacillus thuringiensis]MCU7667987.1 polysaccharide deacetylase family protein [Bacillus thuringiensis]
MRNQTSKKKSQLTFQLGMIVIILIVISAIIFSIFTISVSAFYKNTPVIPVIMYHHFDETYSDNAIVTKKEFYEQMTALKEEGYTPVSQQEVADYYHLKKPLPKKPILITIDDGYTSNYKIAYPILKKLEMKATIFTITGQVGKKPGSLPHFSWENAQDMIQSGSIEIQSHTNNLHHKELLFLHKESALVYQRKDETQSQYFLRIFKDLFKSREKIQNNLGVDSIAISYPFGETNKEAIKMVRGAGFKLGYSTKKGLNTKYSDPYLLKRINIPGGTSGEELIEMITP